MLSGLERIPDCRQQPYVPKKRRLDHKPVSYRPTTLAKLRHLAVSFQPAQVQ